MVNQISKELLSEVLELNECVHIQTTTNEIYYYHKVSSFGMTPHGYMEQKDIINIHELAHKCKEWASNKDYIIASGKNKLGRYWADIIEKDLFPDVVQGTTVEETEHEAIFKACEWILKKVQS